MYTAIVTVFDAIFYYWSLYYGLSSSYVLKFVYFNDLCIGSGGGGGIDIQLFWPSFLEVEDQDTLIEQ